MRMTKCIGVPAMLEQLAEECAECGKAVLKLSRILRKENPTPVSEGVAKAILVEEYTDIVQCAEDLGLFIDVSQIKNKKECFERRYNEFKRNCV